MRCAIVFPGQGAQYLGMASALAAEESLVAETLRQADEVLDLPLSRLIDAGPAEELSRTSITQPAVLAVSVAMWRLLRQRHPELQAVAAAGHSLGEFSALVAAGCLDYGDALRLVRLRGQEMQRAVPEGVGAMVALIGLRAAQIEALCALVCEQGVVRAACYNAPTQTVVAGHRRAVERVVELARAHGCRHAVPLAVSAPFHTPLLEPAGRALRAALQEVEISPPAFPVLHNVDALPAMDPQEIRRKLVQQVTHAVRWQECALGLLEYDPQRVLEVGPGYTLTGLMRRIHRKTPVLALDRSTSWERLHG